MSFEEFAGQYRRCEHVRNQKKDLEHRLIATRIAIGLSARLLRIDVAAQKGLLEAFKYSDKSGFIAIFNAVRDIQDACESALHRNIHRPVPVAESALVQHCDKVRSSGFMHQLTSQARDDLLRILTLVRTDSEFLFERISSLSSAQLTALTSAAASLDVGDVVSAFNSRSRSQQQSLKRNNTHSAVFKDHVLALERNDPLAVLLFNVFAVPLDWDSAEARLRLDVWSTTCSKLLAVGGSKYYTFLGHVLSHWTQCSDWAARPKLELYLMDVLQQGAFLLENVESPMARPLGGAEAPDPLRTDVAEEFFVTAIKNLFGVLDDADAGLPSAVLEFTNAILAQLTSPETKNGLIEYIFIHWFFTKFLYNTMCFPEVSPCTFPRGYFERKLSDELFFFLFPFQSQGLLLDFHISKDAREKLLGQIALRAQAQVYRVLHSLYVDSSCRAYTRDSGLMGLLCRPQFATVHPEVRRHVECMLSKFVPSTPPSLSNEVHDFHASRRLNEGDPSVSAFVMLSSADVTALLNALFPKNSPSSEPFSLASPHRSPNAHFRGGAKFQRASLPSQWIGNVEKVPERPTILGGSLRGLHSETTTYSKQVDAIRFELSDISVDLEGRPLFDHPSVEDWAILNVSEDGKTLSWCPPTSEDASESLFDSFDDGHDDDDGQYSPTIQPEQDTDALQTAIRRLVTEPAYGQTKNRCGCSLQQRFDAARSICAAKSDFLGAHYWWEAAEQLRQKAAKVPSNSGDDSWIIRPMLKSCNRLLSHWRGVIKDCENGLIRLSPIAEHLQTLTQDTKARATKFRNKMWYMTDVKNSMRYEDAKHVALALKTMVYPSVQRESADYRFRSGSRYLSNSMLQKPEMQVMNVMKASSSQGGPNKLSDEQVELTRKWMSHHGIDNFCQGEERIHRFCYEVKASINKLVGDTMSETPVLWASELFQAERAKFDSSSGRSFGSIPSAPGVRPSSISSEDALFTPYSNVSLRTSESVRSQDVPTLMSQSSFQSLSSDKWRTTRNFEADTLSSLDYMAGKTSSSSTTDSYSAFWSPPQTMAQSTVSASSFQSRPPSMFSDAPAPRRSERDTHGKTAFLDDLRQTLTGLLLSDLGSPVWSCGSETDAWFISYLNDKRVQVQMDKRAKIQKFLAESELRSNQRVGRSETRGCGSSRRAESADPATISRAREATDSANDNQQRDHSNTVTSDTRFRYHDAFRQLIDVFSRNANPYIKLKALRDLRALVVASLNAASERPFYRGAPSTLDLINQDAPYVTGGRVRRRRHSLPSRGSDLLSTPVSPPPESIELESHPSYDIETSQNQVVNKLKELLREFQPKTLFRDLQFVSAFVPNETLNKTDSGTAFLEFGLAALSLKEEVCSAMVELADRIVSQELSRRHSQPGFDLHLRPHSTIEDAAKMWIITAKEGNPVAQRELAILYLTHPEILPRVTLPLTLPRDTFKAEMMYRRDKDSKSDPQSMCLALHWMQASAAGGDELAKNRLREREEFESLV